MIALVTGSTGFIGSHLCRELCRQGIQVRAFQRATSNTMLLNDLPVEHFIGDLQNPKTLLPALDNVEVVFHAGAVLNSGEGWNKLAAVNIAGTRALFQAALQQGVKRVIYTSSVAALGVPEDSHSKESPQSLLNESHTWNYDPTRWKYGYSKYLSEMEVQYAVSQGLDVVIVNPAVVFGPGNIARQSSSPVVLIAKKRLPVTVPAGLNVVHVNDVVSGHLAAWKVGRTGERYILGAHNIDVSSLLQEIARLTGGKAPQLCIPVCCARHMASLAGLAQILLRVPLDTSLLHLAGYNFFYDTHKATDELHLPPPYSLEAAILDSYHWFQNNLG